MHVKQLKKQICSPSDPVFVNGLLEPLWSKSTTVRV